MNNTELKKKQKEFVALRDVSPVAGGLIIAAGLLFLTAPKWVPAVFNATLDVGKFGTYAIAVVALGCSAYATLQTFYMKRQDRCRAVTAAKFTLSSDACEILREYDLLKKSISEIPAGRQDLWNKLLDEFALIENRVERKQDRLVLLSANLAPELFPVIQELYLSMLKLTSRRTTYYINITDLDMAATKQVTNSHEMVQEMDEAQNTIIKNYEVLQAAITGLQQLPIATVDGSDEKEKRGKEGQA